MSEASAALPLRAPGEYAGTKCEVKSCSRYARFVVQPGGGQTGHGTCAAHLSVIMRTVMLLSAVAPVTQEVPGNWGRELVLVEGVIARF